MPTDMNDLTDINDMIDPEPDTNFLDETPFYDWHYYELSKTTAEKSFMAELEQYQEGFLSVEGNAVFKGLFEEHGIIEMLCFIKNFHIESSDFVSASAQNILSVIQHFSDGKSEIESVAEVFASHDIELTELEIVSLLSDKPVYLDSPYSKHCEILGDFVRAQLINALHEYTHDALDGSFGYEHKNLCAFMVMFAEEIRHHVYSVFDGEHYSKKTLNLDSPLVHVVGAIGTNALMGVIASPLPMNMNGLPSPTMLREVSYSPDNHCDLSCVAANLYLEGNHFIVDTWGSCLVSAIQELKPSLTLMQIGEAIQRESRQHPDSNSSAWVFECLGHLLIGAVAASLQEPYRKQLVATYCYSSDP